MFSQQISCSLTQAPPQQRSPPAHSNLVPSSFLHCTAGLRRREVKFCAVRSARSEFSSPLHSPRTEHSSFPCATAVLTTRRARVTMGVFAISSNAKVAELSTEARASKCLEPKVATGTHHSLFITRLDNLSSKIEALTSEWTSSVRLGRTNHIDKFQKRHRVRLEQHADQETVGNEYS